MSVPVTPAPQTPEPAVAKKPQKSPEIVLAAAGHAATPHAGCHLETREKDRGCRHSGSGRRKKSGESCDGGRCRHTTRLAWADGSNFRTIPTADGTAKVEQETSTFRGADFQALEENRHRIHA